MIIKDVNILKKALLFLLTGIYLFETPIQATDIGDSHDFFEEDWEDTASNSLYSHEKLFLECLGIVVLVVTCYYFFSKKKKPNKKENVTQKNPHSNIKGSKDSKKKHTITLTDKVIANLKNGKTISENGSNKTVIQQGDKVYKLFKKKRSKVFYTEMKAYLKLYQVDPGILMETMFDVEHHIIIQDYKPSYIDAEAYIKSKEKEGYKVEGLRGMGDITVPFELLLVIDKLYISLPKARLRAYGDLWHGTRLCDFVLVAPNEWKLIDFDFSALDNYSEEALKNINIDNYVKNLCPYYGKLLIPDATIKTLKEREKNDGVNYPFAEIIIKGEYE